MKQGQKENLRNVVENLGWRGTLKMMNKRFRRKYLNLIQLLILETKMLLLKHI